MPINDFPYVNIASWPENLVVGLQPTPRPRIYATAFQPSTSDASFDVGGAATTRWTIRGTWVGELFFEASLDGVTWTHPFTTAYAPMTNIPIDVTSTTINGNWIFSSAGFLFFRLRGTVTSGSAEIVVVASPGAAPLAQTVPVTTMSTPLPTPISQENDVTGTGVAVFAIKGASTLRLQLTDTTVWAGVVRFEVSMDDGNTWILINMLAFPSSSVAAYTNGATAKGHWATSVTGFSHIRVRGDSVTGTVHVQFVAGQGAVPLPTPGPTEVPLTDAQLRATPVPVTGVVSNAPAPPAGATITNPTITAASSVILAANAARRRFVIINDSGAIVYIAFGATATPSTHTIRLANNERYDGVRGDYTGVVSCVRASGSGTIQVTSIQ